jgi:hypothetical protein
MQDRLRIGLAEIVLVRQERDWWMPLAVGDLSLDHMREEAMRSALADCDMLIRSGGTSKGAGDVTYRILARPGSPGVLVHGVA